MKGKTNFKVMFWVLFILGTLVTLTVGVVHAQGAGEEGSPLPATPDNAILAAETGLSVSDIDSAIAFQEAFVEYAEGLINQFPGQISAVWMDSPSSTQGPSTRGHVRFKEEVPSGVTPIDNVALTGNGMLSIADHKRRAEVATDALVDLGYQNFATFFDPKENVIRIEVLIPDGATQPSKSDIVSAMRERSNDVQIKQADLALAVLTGSGPFITTQHSRGGNWLLEDGTRECTSGWSVSGSDGDGIVTAAHCDGLNQFEEPGETPYGITLRDEEKGSGGDVEYPTTEHVEYAEFYSDATTIRDVTSIKTTATMVGGTVCVYGRASNVRTCNHEVEAVNVTVSSGSGGCSCMVGSLARTDSSSTTGGDSCGGWSYNHAAWGVHRGKDANAKGYFTPVEEAQSALNVTIKIQTTQ